MNRSTPSASGTAAAAGSVESLGRKTRAGCKDAAVAGANSWGKKWAAREMERAAAWGMAARRRAKRWAEEAAAYDCCGVRVDGEEEEEEEKSGRRTSVAISVTHSGNGCQRVMSACW